MTKAEQNILNHLRPITEYADTYFCSSHKYNGWRAIDNLLDKVTRWVERNGGKIKELSDVRIIGDRKGYIVKITFPTYNKRDMKNVMATIYRR